MTYEKAYEKLAEYGQTQVLKYYESLSGAEKEALLSQIETIDFSFLKETCTNEEAKGKITPIKAMELSESERRKKEFDRLGLEAIREGKVAAVLLAGGMGTRLGSDKPKGMFNIGVTRTLYIFECLFNNLKEVVERAGKSVPVYIMTSDKNDADTRAFFKEKNWFGYDPAQITFFIQKMAPATGYDGKILLETPCSMALSPNGNGGWFASMNDNGLLSDLRARKIEWLNVFAVDNVLQRIADPTFVGATIAEGCEVGAKVIRKNAPDEKVGVICLEDGHPSIVEYYELTDELIATKDEKGECAYNFGVILNYLFKESALETILKKRLPLHRVEKKIPYLNEKGERIEPKEPNGYKYENLVLDMIKMLDSCLPFEVVREKEFAPIKNKVGKDSVESARELLKANGVIL